MKKYTKIDTIFERDINGTKKLIEGKFRDKTVEFLKDNEWICTEKIDGTNIGIVWDGHAVSYQGRTEKSKIPADLLDTLNECFGGSINEELFEQKFGEMPIILFGEGHGRGIQSKRGYKFKPKFILFDAYLPEKDLWMGRESIEDIAQTFAIEAVPIVMRATLQEAVDFVKTKPKSVLNDGINMEGLVCKPAVDLLSRVGKRMIVKIKVEDFI
jgi:hypothetical protein